MKKKFLIGLLAVVMCFALVGCGNKATEKESKSIVISNVDKDTRWEAISNYDITLEFENDKCVSENGNSDPFSSNGKTIDIQDSDLPF